MISFGNFTRFGAEEAKAAQIPCLRQISEVTSGQASRSSVFASLYRRKIQAPSGPPAIDPLIAHDQSDPRARDFWISQIDILLNQPGCALAPRIDETSARSII